MKQKVGQKDEAPRDGWKGYVNWSPLAVDRDAAGTYLDDPLWSVEMAVEQLSESGYTVSISHESATGGFRLALTGKTKPCENLGYTLSVRASTVARVMALAWRYVYGVCDGGAWFVERDGKDLW